jgi:endonuclease YncB( thermonuclease family)
MANIKHSYKDMFYFCRCISCMKFTKPIAFLLPLGILAAPRLAAAELSAVVAGVHDGDTLTVLSGERSIRIRLSGIDSPEMNQPFGGDARSFTAELALGTTVTVIEEKMDRYGRLVAWVVLADGRNLNHEIVAAGFAWWYRQMLPGDRVLPELESDANQKGRGLWAARRADSAVGMAQAAASLDAVCPPGYPTIEQGPGKPITPPASESCRPS